MRFLLCALCSLLVLMGFPPAPARAAPLAHLGLGEALAKAEAHALLGAEFAEASRFYERRESEQWRKLALPALTVQRTERSGNLTGAEQEQVTEARLEYLLYAGGRDRAGYRSAQQSSAANRYDQQRALAELRLMTAEAYLQFANTRQRLQSLELAVQTAETEVKNAQRRTQLGLRTGLEVLQARVALEDQRLELKREVQRQRELALQLSHLVREEVTPATGVETEEEVGPPPEPLAHYRDWAERHHPAVLLAQAELHRAEQEAALNEAVHYPEVLLSAGYADASGANENRSVALSLVYRFGGHRASVERSDNRANIEQRFFQVDPTQEVSELTFVEERDTTTTTYGVTFFDFRDAAATAESTLLQARLALAQSGRLLIEAREARLREIEQRLGQLQAARSSYEVETLRVAKNEAELKAYRKAFEAGTVRYEELLDKQTQLTQSRLDRINAQVQVRLSKIDLHSAAGLPLLKP